MSTDVEALCEARNACIRLLQRRGVPYDSYADCVEHLRGYPATLEHYRRLRADFVNDNMGLVYLVVNRYCTSTTKLQYGFEDLVQEGVHGLLRAIDKFSLEKKAKFSTYACFWIRQKVIRALEKRLRTIRLPAHKVRELVRLRKKRDKTADEQEEYVNLLRLSDMTSVSDETEGKEERGWLVSKQTREIVTSSLGILPERQRIIISLRFGLTDDEERSLEAVGEHVGLSRERVRQLEAMALQQLREYLEKKGLE